MKTGGAGMRMVDPVKAYEILQGRMVNEDRIIVERTNLFLVSSSFLYIGFVTLAVYIFNASFNIQDAFISLHNVMVNLPDSAASIQDTALNYLLYLLPSIGTLLSQFLYHFNINATNILTFWHGTMAKLEDTAPEFFIFRPNRITPHRDGHIHQRGKAKFERDSWIQRKRNLLGRIWHSPLFGEGNSQIYRRWIPLAFFLLWFGSLIIVMRCLNYPTEKYALTNGLEIILLISVIIPFLKKLICSVLRFICLFACNLESLPRNLIICCKRLIKYIRVSIKQICRKPNDISRRKFINRKNYAQYYITKKDKKECIYWRYLEEVLYITDNKENKEVSIVISNKKVTNSQFYEKLDKVFDFIKIELQNNVPAYQHMKALLIEYLDIWNSTQSCEKLDVRFESDFPGVKYIVHEFEDVKIKSYEIINTGDLKNPSLLVTHTFTRYNRYYEDKTGKSYRIDGGQNTNTGDESGSSKTS